MIDQWKCTCERVAEWRVGNAVESIQCSGNKRTKDVVLFLRRKAALGHGLLHLDVVDLVVELLDRRQLRASKVPAAATDAVAW